MYEVSVSLLSTVLWLVLRVSCLETTPKLRKICCRPSGLRSGIDHREHRRMSGSCLSSWEPWELSVIPSQHRRMSGTRQKEPGSTEGCQGAACHHWEPWELSVIPSQHRRMSGTRQKEPGSTKGCQREPASSLYYYIYVIRPAKYHSFIESAIFHRFIVSAKYHRFFSQKRAKTFILSRNTKTFQEKQKFFRFFLQVSKIVCIFAPSKVN